MEAKIKMLENYKRQGKTKAIIQCKVCNKEIKSLFEDWQDLIRHLKAEHKEISIDYVMLSNYGKIIEVNR